MFAGLAGDRRWEFATSGGRLHPDSEGGLGERRLYALTANDQLAYVQELALEPGDYRPHLNATLTRQQRPGSRDVSGQ